MYNLPPNNQNMNYELKLAMKLDEIQQKEQKMNQLLKMQQGRQEQKQSEQERMTNEINRMNGQMNQQYNHRFNVPNTNPMINEYFNNSKNQFGFSGHQKQNLIIDPRRHSAKQLGQHENLHSTKSTNMNDSPNNATKKKAYRFGLDNPSDNLEYKLSKIDEEHKPTSAIVMRSQDSNGDGNQQLKEQSKLISNIMENLKNKASPDEDEEKWKKVKDLEDKFFEFDEKNKVETAFRRIGNQLNQINKDKAISRVYESKNNQAKQMNQQKLQQYNAYNNKYQNYINGVPQAQGQNVSDNPGEKTYDMHKAKKIAKEIVNEKFQDMKEDEKFRKEFENMQKNQNEAILRMQQQFQQSNEAQLGLPQDNLLMNKNEGDGPVIVIPPSDSSTDSDDEQIGFTGIPKEKKFKKSQRNPLSQTPHYEGGDPMGNPDPNDPFSMMMMMQMMNGGGQGFFGGNDNKKTKKEVKKEKKKEKKMRLLQRRLFELENQQNQQVPPMYIMNNGQQNTPQNSQTLPKIKKPLKKTKLKRVAGESIALPPFKAQSIPNPGTLLDNVQRPIEPYTPHNYNENISDKAQNEIYEKPKTPRPPTPLRPLTPPPKTPPRRPRISTPSESESEEEQILPPGPPGELKLKDMSENLKRFWRVAWGVYFALEFCKKSVNNIVSREEVAREFYDNVQIKAMSDTFVSISGTANAFLDKIKNNKKIDVNFLRLKINDKTKNKMVTEITPLLNELMDIMIKWSSPQNPDGLAKESTIQSFIGQAFYPNSKPPDKYFTTFEYNRIPLSTSGRNLSKSALETKMMHGVLFLIRILVNQILLRFFKHFQRPTQKNEHAEENFKAIGYCIYEVFVEVVFNAIQPLNHDNYPVTFVDRIEPRSIPFVENDNLSIDTWKTNMPNNEDDIIFGMPDKDRMAPFINSKGFNEIKGQINQFLDNCYKLGFFKNQQQKLEWYDESQDQLEEVSDGLANLDMYPKLVEDLDQEIQSQKARLQPYRVGRTNVGRNAIQLPQQNR